MTVSGRCACGAVRFTASGPLRAVINCHCSRCRRWTGHFMAATNTDVNDLVFDQGVDSVKWWTPEEEPTVGYGFCMHCGSSLFWGSSSKPGRYSVAAGTLDPPTGLSTVHALFVAEAGDYHEIDPDLPHHLHDSDDEGVQIEGGW